MPFPPSVRRKVLLWCDRHCCLCKRPCGLDIEVDHLIPSDDGGRDDVENALPLCFDCHARVHRYNDRHPRGTKYFHLELRARRDQVYELFTRDLAPPVLCEITQTLSEGKARELPDTGFLLHHKGDGLPVRVRVSVSINGVTLKGHHYCGKKVWRLNPRRTISAHFPLPKRKYRGRISAVVTCSVIDAIDFEHQHLPVQYLYVRKGNFWYLEP